MPRDGVLAITEIDWIATAADAAILFSEHVPFPDLPAPRFVSGRVLQPGRLVIAAAGSPSCPAPPRRGSYDNAIGKVKAEVSFRDLPVAAGVSWDALKSRPGRGGYWAPCPFHREATSSFHLVEPNGVGGWFRCFRCEATGSAGDFRDVHRTWIASNGRAR
ncbi:CHC2 zinc finger domain-containing protein [Paracoccus ravus]|uniref:CHC2 zinc finger domain-containing protein n=1 Tax=Paracoccus ravus TaxID=2447760 RepID=UPI00106EEEEC|nr:CHC2 zinc finger domain-containing protein [Paracoccus ravus]